MAIHQFQQIVPWPRDVVFDWHARPGAFRRLSPPWMALRPRVEATSLADGRAELAAPVGPPWVAQHIASSYVEGHRFEDVCVSEPWRTLTGGWRHAHRFQDAPVPRDGHAATMLLDDVLTRLPRRALAPMMAYRYRQLDDDLASLDRMRRWVRDGAFGERAHTGGLTFALTGASGLVGGALRAFLTTGGHTVVSLTRGAAQGEHERHWSPDAPAPDLLDGVDVLIHLAGEPIGQRFTEEHVRAVRESRVGPTRALARLVADPRGQVRTMVCASAVGLYGPDRGDEVLTETSARGEGVLADVVAAWEDACAPARDAGVRVVSVRTGMVQSAEGGVLALLRPLFLAGLGGRLGDGTQWVPWIGLDDLVDIYARAAVDTSLRGPLNAVAPQPVPNAEYTEALGRAVRRPTWLPVPSLGPQLLLGEDGARELALAGQRAVPTVLEGVGHQFRFPRLADALAHELGGFPRPE